VEVGPPNNEMKLTRSHSLRTGALAAYLGVMRRVSIRLGEELATQRGVEEYKAAPTQTIGAFTLREPVSQQLVH
jgi:hypothetical protein